MSENEPLSVGDLLGGIKRFSDERESTKTPDEAAKAFEEFRSKYRGDESVTMKAEDLGAPEFDWDGAGLASTVRKLDNHIVESKKITVSAELDSSAVEVSIEDNTHLIVEPPPFLNPEEDPLRMGFPMKMVGLPPSLEKGIDPTILLGSGTTMPAMTFSKLAAMRNASVSEKIILVSRDVLDSVIEPDLQMKEAPVSPVFEAFARWIKPEVDRISDAILDTYGKLKLLQLIYPKIPRKLKKKILGTKDRPTEYAKRLAEIKKMIKSGKRVRFDGIKTRKDERGVEVIDLNFAIQYEPVLSSFEMDIKARREENGN